MNAEGLLLHYDRVADTPDAIAQLRRFVLELAVRGKLVPQVERDEPARELLDRINTARTRQIAAGEIRPSKVHEVDLPEGPFTLPQTWVWAALGGVFLYDAGAKREPRMLAADYWLLELEDIEKDTGRLLTRFSVSDRQSQSTKSEFRPGDVLYGKLRPYLNKVLVAGEVGYSTTEIVALRPYLPLCSEYCAIALRRSDFVDYVTRLGQGTKMPRLRSEDAVVAPFPLPPVAEQHRIVAKFNELMELCDRLEVACKEREAARDRLAAVNLARLNLPDLETFAEDAGFALDSLWALSTRPDQIKQIRQTVLSLAVRGKLVRQMSADGSVTSLLRRLTTTRAAQNRSCALVAKGAEPYAIPDYWCWATLDQLIVEGPQNGISPRPSTLPDAPRAITLTATTSGTFNPLHFKRVELVVPQNSDLWLREGDLLFQRGNTREYVGMAAVYTGPPHTFLYPDLMIRVRVSPEVNLRYVHLVCIAPPARGYMAANATGAQLTMPKINQSTLVSLPIPLPPLEEQVRIVAKVEKLMTLCDELESSLRATAEQRSRLLETLLHAALESGRHTEEPAPADEATAA